VFSGGTFALYFWVANPKPLLTRVDHIGQTPHDIGILRLDMECKTIKLTTKQPNML